MRYIFLFFVVGCFDITSCIDIDKSQKKNSAQIEDINLSKKTLNIRDSLVLYRNKLLKKDFSNDIKLFSKLKKVFVSLQVLLILLVLCFQ